MTIRVRPHLSKKKFQSIADETGIRLSFFSSSEQLVNYINCKSISGGSRQSRLNDKIHKFVVFAHGIENSIEFGYRNWYAEDKLSFDSTHISRLFVDSFENPNSCFYSCNTGTGVSSFAQQWVNKTNGKTWAVSGKTSYYNIFNQTSKYNGFYKYGSDNYPTAGENSFWRTFTSKVRFSY